MHDIPRSDIESSLSKKGFRKDESHHHLYFLYVGGKRSSIRTKISHGSKYKTYDVSLLSAMKKQLKFDSLNQLRDFISCTVTEKQYLQLLLKKNLISPDEETRKAILA